MVRSTPFQGVDTGSNPVRITSIMGVRQRWRVGLVCKTSGFRLSEFDSHHSHKCSVRLAGSGRYPFTVKITGSNPVRSTNNKWECANVGELGWSVKPVVRLSGFDSHHSHGNLWIFSLWF